jgi:hypothetical protein
MFDLKDYVGPVKNAQISENVCFENLNAEAAFVKREYVLTFSDGNKIPLSNPDYTEYKNTEEGRAALETSSLSKQHKDTILMVWNPVKG